MNDKRIETGDMVQVFFSRSSTVIGVVDYVPKQPGDRWIILENQANLPVYIQSFDCIILVEKARQ